jgi:molecular chaperone HtpG
VYRKVLSAPTKEQSQEMVRNLADLALLSQGLLKGDQLTNFINRSVALMQGEVKSNIIVTDL